MRTEAATTLPDTCAISRRTRTPDGRGGYTDSWAAIATNVPCRITPNTAPAGGEEQAGRPGQVGAWAPWKIRLASGQDVTVRDRIVVAAFTYPLEVTAVSSGQSWELLRTCYAVEAT